VVFGGPERSLSSFVEARDRRSISLCDVGGFGVNL
jgi:hypothetical protein